METSEHRKRWERRQQFYNRVVTEVASHPERDLHRLATAWRELSGAAWIWVWLFNTDTEEFEIAAAAAPREVDLPIPNRIAPTETFSALRWASLEHETLYIPSTQFRTWCKIRDRERYRLTSADWFEAKRCSGIEYVPFDVSYTPLQQESFGRDLPTAFRGAIGLYYQGTHTPLKETQEPASLSLMARVTGTTLASSYLLAQRELILKMTSLVADFLPPRSTGARLIEPRATLASFSNKMAHLLRDNLPLDGVSLFYRNRENTQVECVGSTGLIRCGDRAVLEPDDFAGANYRSGVGRTGKCFLNGVRVSFRNSHEYSESRYTEVTPEYSEASGPFERNSHLLPIAPISDSQGPRASGVLRCVQSRPLFSRHNIASVDPGKCAVRQCDPIQLDFYYLALKVLGPAVGTLVRRVWREHDIITTQHNVRSVFASMHLKQAKSRIKKRLTDAGLHDELDTLFFAEDMSLRLLSRLSGKSDVDKLEVLSISDKVLDNFVPGMRAYHKGEGVDFQFTCDPTAMAVCVKGDAGRIRDILFELCTNACKYSVDGGTVVLRVSASSSVVRFSVENRGVGVCRAEAISIFEEGVRGNAATQSNEGTGFGLYDSRQIARRMSGDVELISLKDPTIFELWLPVHGKA